MTSGSIPAKHGRGVILALGEILIDLIPAKSAMRISESGAVIKAVSGSSGIFSCAAQRLGGNSGIICKLGRDSLSKLAMDILRRQRLDLRGVTLSEEGQIGLAFLEYTPDGRNYQYYRERSVGSRLRPDDIDGSLISEAFAVHYPGMLLNLSPEMSSACARLTELAKEHNIAVSFDPNLRQELSRGSEALEKVRNAVSTADIITPTLSEARAITGLDDIGKIIRALHSLGPKTVAVTRDSEGSVLSTDGYAAIARALPVNEVDPTGAGDVFAAALCTGIREGMHLKQLAAFANTAAGLAVTKRGAIGTALPSRRAVNSRMDAVSVTVAKLSEL